MHQGHKIGWQIIINKKCLNICSNRCTKKHSIYLLIKILKHEKFMTMLKGLKVMHGSGFLGGFIYLKDYHQSKDYQFLFLKKCKKRLCNFALHFENKNPLAVSLSLVLFSKFNNSSSFQLKKRIIFHKISQKITRV